MNAPIHICISAKIRSEWQMRCIEDVISGLADVDWNSKPDFWVSHNLAMEIVADCEFYIDKQAIDATSYERKAYAALKKQIEKAMAQPA